MLRGELEIDSVRNMAPGEQGCDPARTLALLLFLLFGIRILSSIMLGPARVTTVIDFLMLVVRLIMLKRGRNAVTMFVWNTLRLLMMVTSTCRLCLSTFVFRPDRPTVVFVVRVAPTVLTVCLHCCLSRRLQCRLYFLLSSKLVRVRVFLRFSWVLI